MIYISFILFCLVGFSYCLLDTQTFRPSLSDLLNPDVYPERSVYGIKSIQTDFWNIDDVYGNGGGGAAINYVWANYQPVKKLAPCGTNEEEYEGYCFWIDQPTEAYTKQYTDKSLTITGILIMVPEWARQNNIYCNAPNKYFCSPDDGADFGRFAGFLARRYNGRNGNGRIMDFVIHNEVNSADWFNIGCGRRFVCNADAWIDVYASSYINAYDQIVKHQKNAKVLISLTHHFDYVFDSIIFSSTLPTISAKTFLEKLAPKLGQRNWSVAFHSYPPNLLNAEFSRDDLPRITFGNVNILVGWLMQTFPNTPSAWKVYLTENGINSVAPYSDETKQNFYLCQAFRNIINTPFIENFVYHRMKDHPTELAMGLGLGLVNQYGQYKAAWSTWALSNRFDVGLLSCGFENLPYLILKRGFRPGSGHWATTRDLPDGYSLETKFKIYRETQPDTRLLYECKVQSMPHNFVSIYMNCENQFHLGPLGYVYTVQKPNTIPLYRCYVPANGDHFISIAQNCEYQTFEQLLGYVFQN